MFIFDPELIVPKEEPSGLYIVNVQLCITLSCTSFGFIVTFYGLKLVPLVS
jgi:hypothetical protein